METYSCSQGWGNLKVCRLWGRTESDTTEATQQQQQQQLFSVDKESAHNAEDLGSIPGLGRSTGEGKGCPLQYSGLENSAHAISVNMSFEDVNDCQLLQENPHSLAFLW